MIFYNYASKHDIGFPMTLAMAEQEMGHVILKMNVQAKEAPVMEAVHRDLVFVARVSTLTTK